MVSEKTKNLLIAILVVITVAMSIHLFVEDNIFNFNDDLNNVKKPHFTKNNLSYKVYVNSTQEYEGKYYQGNDTYQKQRIKRAFELVSNASNNTLNFYELPYNTSKDVDIDVWAGNSYNDYCDNFLPYVRELEEITMGVGEILEYKEKNKKIYYSEITLCSTFRENSSTGDYYVNWEKDDYPSTEVHELLHSLGFDHTNKKCHIMNPYTKDNCNFKIEKDISNCLENIYSNNKTNSCDYKNFMF